jgi:SpoVK/Ycf46/Vps4 family AAA+-type ATPase
MTPIGGFMLTKRFLLKKIEDLQSSYNNITNFDELYKKIMDSYQTSKTLISEQVLEYDKKIFHQQTAIESKTKDFGEKVDQILNQSFENNKNALIKFQSELENFFFKGQEQLSAISNDLKTSFKNQIEEEASKFQSKITENFKKHDNDLEEAVKQSKNLISQYVENSKLNIIETVQNIFNQRINQVLLADISNNASREILDSFNKILFKMKEPEVNSIVDGVKLLINKELENLPAKPLEKKKLLPIKKEEVFHKNKEKLKTCIEASSKEIPIIPMIVGPAGTGKSTAVEQISRELKLNFYMANRIQNTFELLGFVDASGKYVTTQFYEAFVHGGVFLFDEVDASSPEALVTINAALSQGYMAFPGQPNAIQMHPDFKVVCAGNTFGSGATLQYTGRNKLDAATLDRFMIIEWDYDLELEKKLIPNKDLLEFCWKLRLESSKIDPAIIISTRGILILDKLLKHDENSKNFEISEVLKQKFFETTKKENLKKIYEVVSQTLNKNPYFIHLENLIK